MEFAVDSRAGKNIPKEDEVEFTDIEGLVDYCAANGRVEFVLPGKSADGLGPINNTGKVLLFFHNDYD